MAPAPPAGNAVTGTHDEAGAPGTRAPVPVISGRGPRMAQALLPRRAQTSLPAAARSDRTGSAQAETRGDCLRRVVGLVRKASRTCASYYDPLFERPDLVEDDYYRLRNQPRDCSGPDARL
jgi:hypothetical protein